MGVSVALSSSDVVAAAELPLLLVRFFGAGVSSSVSSSEVAAAEEPGLLLERFFGAGVSSSVSWFLCRDRDLLRPVLSFDAGVCLEVLLVLRLGVTFEVLAWDFLVEPLLGLLDTVGDSVRRRCQSKMS